MSAPLNFQTLFELDINPGGTANYVRIGNGLVSASVSNNEAVDEKGYLDGSEMASAAKARCTSGQPALRKRCSRKSRRSPSTKVRSPTSWRRVWKTIRALWYPTAWVTSPWRPRKDVRGKSSASST